MNSFPLAAADASLPSDDLIAEQMYLVARGVRPMALVGWSTADPLVMLRVATRLESVADPGVLPFVIDHQDGSATFGYAAARWVVDLYEWLVRDNVVPQEHRERITGMLLGYASEAISRYEDSGTGRRFLSPSESAGRAAS
jgi:hypothetical protein